MNPKMGGYYSEVNRVYPEMDRVQTWSRSDQYQPTENNNKSSLVKGYINTLYIQTLRMCHKQCQNQSESKVLMRPWFLYSSCFTLKSHISTMVVWWWCRQQQQPFHGAATTFSHQSNWLARRLYAIVSFLNEMIKIFLGTIHFAMVAFYASIGCKKVADIIFFTIKHENNLAEMTRVHAGA